MVACPHLSKTGSAAVAQPLSDPPVLPLGSQSKAVNAHKPLADKADRWMPSLSWQVGREQSILLASGRSGARTMPRGAEISFKCIVRCAEGRATEAQGSQAALHQVVRRI